MKKPIVLWHASRADIGRPTIEGRTDGDHHANSGLGIYCATEPHDYIIGFGNHVHKMELAANARIGRITVRDLQDMGHTETGEHDRACFEQERTRRAQEHDVLLVLEANGYPSQSIILNDAVIAQSERMTKEDFLSQSITIADTMRAHDARQQAMQAQARAGFGR